MLIWILLTFCGIVFADDGIWKNPFISLTDFANNSKVHISQKDFENGILSKYD